MVSRESRPSRSSWCTVTGLPGCPAVAANEVRPVARTAQQVWRSLIRGRELRGPEGVRRPLMGRCTASRPGFLPLFHLPTELASLRRVRYAPMLRQGEALDLSHAPLDSESDNGGASVQVAVIGTGGSR
jgi:hypothetical protein